MKLIYLAHPYGGEDENIIKALSWEAYLFAPNTHVLNAVYYFSTYKRIKEEHEIMKMCLDMVTRCDELWVAPGWEDSPGCKAEIAQATKYNMKIRYLTEGSR